MAKVDIEKLEKEAQKSVRPGPAIPEKVINGVMYFQNTLTGEWSNSRDEVFQELQRMKRVNEFKKQGLDEFGRSPEMIALSNAKAELLKQREIALSKVREIDVRISELKLKDFKPGKSKKK